MSPATTTKITVAVIGVGLIGPRHCRTVKASAEADLIAIVDFQSHGAKLAEELETNYYKTIADLLASPHKPEAAIICTPNHTHVSVAKELSSAGIHVLIEKPFSVDIQSGHDLLAHLKESGVKTLVGHHRRFNPYMVATKELIHSGSLGEITAINGLWTVYKPLDYFDPPAEWRRKKDGGAVLINLIHEIDLLHYLFGSVVRVQTEKTISRRGFEAEEGAVMTFKFQSGVVGSFIVSDNTPSPHNFESGTGENPLIPKTGLDFYRIFGTDATLSIPDMTRWSYDGTATKSWHQSLTKESVLVVPAVPFELQLDHFVKVIRGIEEASCSAEAGLAALVVCEAVRKSLSTGQAVEIEPLKM